MAADFISRIDNLPKEVEHLLDEIKLKDQKCQELLQNVARDQARYVKSALKSVSSSSFSTLGLNGQKSASPTPTPTGTNSKTHLPGRIASAYAEIAVLNDEKIVLAQSLINLLSLSKARLDVDLVKVKTLQGEDNRASSSSQLTQFHPASSFEKRPEAISGISTVVQINQSLRNATMNMHADASGPGYNKKRRITTNTSIKLSSPIRGSTPQAISRSRPSRHAQVIELEDFDLDADAEGEEDYEGEDAEEDLTLYCFCKKQSYGGMIGCDNPSCQYQWFHIACVGVKHPFPENWYCPDCSKRGISLEKRKGRKK